MKSKEEMLAMANTWTKNTLMETLGIQYIDFGDDYLVASMPVTPAVHQPNGVLHGGANVALAESVGSAASAMLVDGKKYQVRGIEISANHLKSKVEGTVYARAEVMHKGRTTHLWQIRITDEEGKLISLCKITNIVLEKKA